MAIFELLDYIVNEVSEPAALLGPFPDNTRANVGIVLLQDHTTSLYFFDSSPASS